MKLGKTEHRFVTITAMRYTESSRSYHRDTPEIPNSAFGGLHNSQIHLKYIPLKCSMDCYVEHGFSWCDSLQRCTRPSDTEWSKPSDTLCPDTVPATTPPTTQCAGDYGSNDPCCGQGGGDVDLQFQCPHSKPTCVNYVYDHHWGTCE